MIAKIVKGSRAGGLMHYLLGPGKHDEHVDPTVIGSWDGRPERFAGVSPAEIGRKLEEPLAIQKLDPTKLVWHTSLRAHDDDRILSDDEWVEVARDVLDRTRIAPRGDDGAARWVVVRHDEGHVHLAAVLARQDTGAKIYPQWDYRRAREVCELAEKRLGLRPTNQVGHGRPGRSRPEEERLREQGVDLRARLRRSAQVAAATATGTDGYIENLRGQGVMVELVERGGETVGYRVAVPPAPGGSPVWFGGSKLHRELSWPKLQQRGWSASSGVVDGGDVADDVERAARQVAATAVEDLDGTDVPAASAELVRAAAYVLDGPHGTGLTEAVDEFYRSVGEAGRSTSLGMELRTLSVALMLGDRRRDTATRVVMNALLLIEATGRLRELQQRAAQADAAFQAGTQIKEVLAERGPRPPISAPVPKPERGPVTDRRSRPGGNSPGM